MRAGALWTESWRNIRSGTTRAGWLVVLLALGLAALGTLDLMSVTALQRASLTFDSAGGSTRILAAEATVDGTSCEALVTYRGVRAAGALRAGPAVTLAAARESPLTTFEVSPAFASVIGVRATGTGVWISRELARTLGAQPGQALQTSRGTMAVAGVFEYPADGRDARLTYAVLVPGLASGRFDECWARAWPAPAGLEDAMRWTARVVPGSLTPLQVAQLNNALGPVYDAHSAFSTRPTRWVAAGSVMLAAGLGWGSIRRRRLELASALHAGQRRADFTAGVLIEAAAWALGGALLGLAVLGAIAVAVAPASAWSVWTVGVGTVLIGAVTAVAAAVAASLLIRTRQLFAYFKDR